MSNNKSFRDHELAWTFHRNTCRWAHNANASEGHDDTPEPGDEYPAAAQITLPEPLPVTESLQRLLSLRCSCRNFSGTSLSPAQLGSVLHCGLGVWETDYWENAEFLGRPVPSGGGMFPLELFVLCNNIDDVPAGIHHYQPLCHCLEEIRQVQLPGPLLKYLFMGQYPVTQAAAIVIISANFTRSMKKYGDRGYRYLLMEAGHVAQNINLTCLGLGFESLNIGGFFDDEVAQLCQLDSDTHAVLYAIAIGKGATPDRHFLRFPS